MFSNSCTKFCPLISSTNFMLHLTVAFLQQSSILISFWLPLLLSLDTLMKSSSMFSYLLSTNVVLSLIGILFSSYQKVLLIFPYWTVPTYLCSYALYCGIWTRYLILLIWIVSYMFGSSVFSQSCVLFYFALISECVSSICHLVRSLVCYLVLVQFALNEGAWFADVSMFGYFLLWFSLFDLLHFLYLHVDGCSLALILHIRKSWNLEVH